MGYTKSEIKAVTRIQQWWKQCLAKLSQRRRLLSLPKGQAYKRYAKLCTKHTIKPATRNHLLSKGYVVYSKLITLQLSQLDQLEYVLRLIEEANLTDDSSHEKWTNCWERLAGLEQSWKMKLKRCLPKCLLNLWKEEI